MGWGGKVRDRNKIESAVCVHKFLCPSARDQVVMTSSDDK